ncbi:MAG: hypothetical protein BMS9Abin25_0845 [Gammaproteobacteria bacterium]|nr:MAG: hypothetical protein BMS9Abin25_0845 [Gammaproteobacteria bacterium]
MPRYNFNLKPRILFIVILLSTLIIPFSNSLALDRHYSSGRSKVSLVELFTSEGCSSCPPAEKWMTTLADDPDLWNRFVPVAFHVDYWDYIGWKDPFATPEYGLRQRLYRQLGNIRTVYTPGMILDGKEWRKWSYKHSTPRTDKIVGNLDVVLRGDTISATFKPASMKSNGDTDSTDWVINVAVLGFDLTSFVKAGENAGRRLKQDFVVLKHEQKLSSDGHWTMMLPEIKPEIAKRIGLAVWVNKKGEQTPVQATGGWL